MKKSSLKTFLAGKNPYLETRIKGSRSLMMVWPEDDGAPYESSAEINNENWWIDVLDDGIAITYCPEK